MNMQGKQNQQKSKYVSSPEQNYLFIFTVRYPVTEPQIWCNCQYFAGDTGGTSGTGGNGGNGGTGGTY